MDTAFETIVVPYDFTPPAHRALEVGLELAQRLDAKLHLVQASHTPKLAVPASTAGGAGPHPMLDVAAWEREKVEELEKVARALDAPRGGAEAHVKNSGTLVDSICDAAEELGADMIVMGTHGRTGLAHVFLGSVTERTVRHAPCPVLAIPVGEDAPERPRPGGAEDT